MSRIVTFVVPAGSGGVRDYAEVMASGLREAGFDARVFAWTQRDRHAIDDHIAASDCLYLQYSGYGFAKRGAPLWMLRYLRTRRARIKCLGIFFHELYAHGPPWRSAFWLSTLQRHVVARLARLADFWMTNRSAASQWLVTHAASPPAAVLPVISNVGELATCRREREKIAVVFGSGPRRRNTWLAAGEALFRWAESNGVKLYDVGPAFADAQLELLLERKGVLRPGRLEAAAASALFSKAMFGVLACSIEYVEKSGVFAAYCAHGAAPLLISRDYGVRAAIEAGRHYFKASLFDEPLPADHTQVGEAAWQWYQSHSLREHLRILGQHIAGSPVQQTRV